LSYGIGQYGDTVGLATPIEQMLGEGPPSATGSRAGARAGGGVLVRGGARPRVGAADRAGPRVRIRPRLLRRARPLASPLSIGGVSPALGRTIAAAGRRAGRTVRAAPAGPLAGLRPQELRPGASVFAGYAAGDLSAGGLGTVTYADGGRVWAFGHPFEGVGARRLLLQDAYVYGVVYNPTNALDAVSYKLGAAGNVLGTLTDDALDAVVGRVGAAPPVTDVRVRARNSDTGRRVGLQSQVADESKVGNPLGTIRSLIVPLALTQADSLALRASPPEQSLSLCMRMSLAGRSAPLRFCNRYVGGGGDAATGDATGGSAAAEAMLADATAAIELVDSYDGPPVRLTRVGMDLSARSGLDLADVRRADAPRRVRVGRPFRVGLLVRTPERRSSTKRVSVTLPRGTRPGLYELHVAGTRPDAVDQEQDLEDLLAGQMAPAEGEKAKTKTKAPRTIEELAARIAALSRVDGVTVRLGRPGAKGGRVVGRFLDPAQRLSGQAAVKVRVRG